MIDLKKAAGRASLMRAIEESRRLLDPFRRKRHELIKEFVGSEYGDHGAPYDVLINKIQQFVELAMQTLVPNNPRFSVTPRGLGSRPFSVRFQMTLNDLVEKIHFDETLAGVVMDAMFAIGIVKTAPVRIGAGMIGDQWVVLSGPGCHRISLDDAFWDMTVKRWSQIEYMGDKYSVARQDLEEDDRFRPDVVKQLLAKKLEDQEDGDSTPDSVAIGREQPDEAAQVREKVQLCDVWLPYQGKVATLAWKNPELPPLYEEKWAGPRDGAYRTLRFLDAPDNLMPTAPVPNMALLHDFLNRIMRRIRRQAGNQKTVHAYEGGQKDDAERFRDVPDGGFVKVQSIQGIKTVSTPGPDASNLSMLQILKAEVNEAGKNIEAAAGLGPQAETVGQEELIHERINVQQQRMAEKVTKFCAAVGNDLAHWLWIDPVYSAQNVIQTKFARKPVAADWQPDYRVGELADYIVSIEPYSLTFTPPAQKMAMMRQFVAQELPVLLPFLEAAGGTFDAQAYVNFLAEFYNIPQFAELIRFVPSPIVPTEATTERPAMPAHTSRTYNRRNLPSGQQADNGIATALAAIQSQQADNRNASMT